LATVSGRAGRGVLAGERHLADPAPAGSGRGGCRLRGGAQPVVGEVGGVGEAGGLADHHPDARPAVAPRRQLLDAAVVEHRRRRSFVFHEDLGEVAAGAQGGGERALDDGLVEHGRPLFGGGFWLVGAGR
jgi:hypothetical protein